MRERGKRREYDQYEDHEAEKKEEMLRERKKIAAFLADYDDEKDDEKYYRGSVLARRIRDREREMDGWMRGALRQGLKGRNVSGLVGRSP